MSAQALCFLDTQSECLEDSGLRYSVHQAEVQRLSCVLMALQAQVHKTAGVDKTWKTCSCFRWDSIVQVVPWGSLGWSNNLWGGGQDGPIYMTRKLQPGMPSVQLKMKSILTLKLCPAPGWRFWLSALSSTSQVLPFCGFQLLWARASTCFNKTTPVIAVWLALVLSTACQSQDVWSVVFEVVREQPVTWNRSLGSWAVRWGFRISQHGN